MTRRTERTERLERHDPEEDVELGELVEATTSGRRGAMVAVRVSPDLLAKLTRYASARHLSVSEVIRRAAEQLTSPGTQDVAYLTGTVVVGNGLVNGTPTASGGRSRTVNALEDATTAGRSPAEDVTPVGS